MSDRTENPYRRATAVAVTVLLSGLTASLAGNIQSINLEKEPPGVGAYISAVWWPLALFGVIELAVHVPWSDDLAERALLASGMGVVASLAFYISYFHLAHVLSDFGYDKVSTYTGPLAVDLAMLVATAALRRIGQEKRILAKPADGQTILAKPEPEDLGQTILAKLENGHSILANPGQPVLANGQNEDLGQTDGWTNDLGQTEEVAKLATADGQTDQDPDQSDTAHIPLAELDIDWEGLDWDGQYEEIAPGPEPEVAPEPAAEPEPEPAQEPEEPAASGGDPELVGVPAAAVALITEALATAVRKSELTALDKRLAAEKIAPSERTARRWRMAVRDKRARVLS